MFKVGDIIVNGKYGQGVVIAIDNKSIGNKYPIEVEFEDDAIEFTKDGYFDDGRLESERIYLIPKENPVIDLNQKKKLIKQDEKLDEDIPMNRKQAINYLMNNPLDVLMTVTDSNGEPILYSHFLKLNDFWELEFDGEPFKVFCENDKLLFKVVKELKQMSFTEAFNISIKSDWDTFIRSVVTNEDYGPRDLLQDLTVIEIEGLWTIEGIYK